jgi:hypothetical protein
VLSRDSLANLLMAIATGDQARAAELIAGSEEIDATTRALLIEAVAVGPDRSAGARSLGDALRSLGAPRYMANECYRVAFYSGDEWQALAANPMFAFQSANKGGRSADKWVHYFDIYARHLEKYRGRPVRLLEIGVGRGGGLDLLGHFLGPQATVVGIDLDETVRITVEPRYAVEVGDQADPEFLRAVAGRHGPFDIVIDDGGHTMRQQIVSVETLFPLLADGATYLVEDCHTSYMPEYADQGPDGQTFLSWVKDRLDDLNAYHFSKQKDLPAPWQTDLAAVHAYDSVVVFDKSRHAAPFCEVSGTNEFIGYDRLAATRELELIAARDAALARAAGAAADGMSGVEPRPGEVDARYAHLAGLRDELRNLIRDLGQQEDVPDLRRELAERDEALEQARRDLRDANATTRMMRRSNSWRLTAPLRRIKHLLRRS